MSEKQIQRATELEYLEWFRQEADFGPAHGDVIYYMHKAFVKKTGKRPPKEWDDEYEEGA